MKENVCVCEWGGVTCVSIASYNLQASLLLVDNGRPSALHACYTQRFQDAGVNTVHRCKFSFHTQSYCLREASLSFLSVYVS